MGELQEPAPNISSVIEYISIELGTKVEESVRQRRRKKKGEERDQGQGQEQASPEPLACRMPPSALRLAARSDEQHPLISMKQPIS